ncbi:disease resistance protein RPV1 [Trifolium repens]|nr:disease resistance protein RPV1 [Trifolium repens]
MYEHEFIGKIVEEVLKKITLGITLHVGDYLVGLEPQKQHVISLLNVGSDDTVHMVGIHGIGGIGKTTLALEVYNSIIHQFQCSCFLKVRENYHKNGLELQKILLSQIVEKNIDINSVEEGISILKKLLSKKKVLLLLDDVDIEKQLHDIAGNSNWFGNGSRVIITTRNQRLLTLHGVEAEHTYEVKELNNKDAFELVKWKAFKNEKTDEVFSDYLHVLERAVAYASGLPLALEVIGSHFSNRTIEECKCALDQCERVLDEKIQMTLQLSFDALKKEEKIVFLDIACCFKGYKLTAVEKVLHAHHGYSIKNHINVLVEKSLIKISEYDVVTLHDLVEDMGKDIVRQESPNPGERSRLWVSEDINEVIEENKGTSKIGIIYVNNWIKLERDGEAFNKMENLKTLLIDYGGHFDGSLKHLPNSLRVLDCRSYSTDATQVVFPNKKFQNMRILNLYSMRDLLPIHELSNLPNLEELSIQYCTGVFTSDKSVGFLMSNLKILRIISCTEIKSVPPLDCPSLVELNLSYCYSLESFPLMVNGFVGNLKILRIISCKEIKSVPPLDCPSLVELDLSYCSSLESFPLKVNGFVGNLKILRTISCREIKSVPPLDCPSLVELDLSNCFSLESFPLTVNGFFGNLKILRVSCREIKSFPPLDCPSLVELDLSGCSSLESFPATVNGFAGNLKILRLNKCSKIRIIPLHMLHSLEELNLNDCTSLESFSHVVGLGEKLKTMSIRSCIKLRSIPPLKLTSLEELNLSNCTSLSNGTSRVESIPPLKLDVLEELDLSNFYMLDNFLLSVGEFLKTLRVERCHNLRSFPPIKLDLLETLDLSNCHNLESFSHVVGLGEKLKTMRVRSCSELRSIPPLKVDVLEELALSDCDSLESFSHVVGLGEKLKTMSVINCIKLRSIPPLKLTSLEKLDLSNCTSLQNFPLVVDEFLGKLEILRLENCHNLKSIPPLKLDVLEELDLSNCNMVESFLLLVGEFLGKVKTLRLASCHNIKSIPPLKLDSLEKLDLSNCHNLRSIPRLKLDSLKELDLSHCYSLESFPSVGDGSLENIIFLNIKQCIILKSIPPLKVTLLEKFNISHCLSLESFPEILGDMRNIPELHLDNIPIKELPFPFHNLTPPQTLYPCDCDCEIFDLPNRVGTMSMMAESTIKGEEKVSPMKSSHVEYICLHGRKLSDEYWSISFMLFANVKELHLAYNQFTVLPKSMEKCNFIWKLVLDGCLKLKEIKGIPPCLRNLSALNCHSLTSSSKSKLLNQELHEVGNTWFRLPRAKIPEWFDHQCSAGLSICFWFRNKFPAIVLGVVSTLTWCNYNSHECRVRVIINGNTFFYTHDLKLGWASTNKYHLHLFHMKMENFNDNMDTALLENKWNHAEVDFGSPFMYSGIHVLKEKSSMEDIQFTNPEIELY